jgi:hypothetical protein
VDSAEIRIVKERDQVSLSCLLKGRNGRKLEPKIGFGGLSYFANETLEWDFPNQELCRSLITGNLTESDGTRLISVRLLDTTSRWSSYSSCLIGETLYR